MFSAVVEFTLWFLWNQNQY